MKLDETMISRAIIERYTEKLLASLNVDVEIVGGGPSGLVAAYYLAKNGVKTSLYESHLSVGGGIWGGAMMMNEIVFQEPARPLFEEFDIRHRAYKDGYYTASSVEVVACLTKEACRAGANIFNLVTMEDVVLHENRVCGLVLNWTPVHMAGLHVDPLATRSRFVIDCTGHDMRVVEVLTRKADVKLNVPGGRAVGERSMWADRGESKLNEYTREVYPGLFVAGMAATGASGGHRMGAIFGGMLMSGRRAAELIMEQL